MMALYSELAGWPFYSVRINGIGNFSVIVKIVHLDIFWTS